MKAHRIVPLVAAVVCAAALFSSALTAQVVQKPGSPEDHLPPNITHLVGFGERAVFSPDGSRIAFMSKSWGDAMEIDLRTRAIRLLTSWPQNPGFLRVHYLPNGDYLLLGARTFQDATTTRARDVELWVLKANAGPADRPVPLDQKLFEGVAVSRTSQRIAWANTHGQYPDLIPEGESIIYVADIVYTNGRPSLANKREVARGTVAEGELEPQDFRHDDAELLYSAYRKPFTYSDVKGVNLSTGKVTTYLTNPDEYNEIEGLFPDGNFAAVESSRDQKEQNVNYIDIWKLKLDPPGGGAGFTRLTHWGDYIGYKATNPVVSPDGHWMAFQSGRSADAGGAGVGKGYGLFLYDLTK